jgi:Protein of unknown function DUF262
MPFQTPLTIEKVLDRIQAQDYVLPAIQREFAWDTDQVIRLFDSLMRGYPIGAFLFWKVNAREDSADGGDRDFVFYGFIRNYHELKSPHCPRLDVPKSREVTAILDGQQRLTALNIGLRGSHAEKLPRKWRGNLDAYPEKRLYLNIEQPAGENELGMEYDFRFLTKTEAAERGPSWFLVPDILKFEDLPDIHDYLDDRGLAGGKFAFRTLSRLHGVVKRDGIISYYDEEAQDLDKVLNIFIRVNSGGTPLSYSDLLLSIATAQWSERDARDAIHGLVDDLNQPPQDFAFSKDLILKAGLVLTDIGDIRFKVTNFNRANMGKLEREWDGVARSLRLAAGLLSEFGFSDENLPADSPLVPIAYYLHKRGADSGYISSVRDQPDRDTVRRWVIRSLLKAGVWGSGLDTLLNALRRAIRDNSTDRFPVDAIEKEMVGLGKSLVFAPEEIEDLVDMPYGNRRVFPLLSLLYPGVEVRGQFHEDHVFPKSRFTRRRLGDAGVPEDRIQGFLDRVNGLPNLQLLPGPVNVAKLAELPLAWATSTYPREAERAAYLALHDLDGLPADLLGFIDFYEQRRGRMRDRLTRLLAAGPAADGQPAELAS